MFWAEPFDAKAAVKGCQDGWGVTPRKYWATIEWGGRKWAACAHGHCAAALRCCAACILYTWTSDPCSLPAYHQHRPLALSAAAAAAVP
jgi:hypothetical protein